MLSHRRATTADLDLLATWNHQLIRDEGHRNPMTAPELRNRMELWLSGLYEATIFEIQSSPVAYALCRRDGETVYIRHLFVDRSHRRAGIGREAIRLLLSDIYPDAEHLLAEVLVKNAEGRAFWKAAGFEDYSVAVELFRS